MKVLVIADVHGRRFWRYTVRDHKDEVDKIIFLGDYLDPYSNEIDENQDLMECNDFYDCMGLLNMLNDIISLKKNEPDKYILLTGNHTDSYIWSNFHSATRTDYRNWEKYHKVFSENLNLFNLVWIENNVIFSHAGISEGWAKRMWEELEYPESKYKSVMDTALALNDIPLEEFPKHKIPNYIGEISRYRGGDYIYGSCEWADLLEHIDTKNSTKDNIIPIGEDGIYQIFGHTQLIAPMINEKWACLDCRKAFIVNTETHEIRSDDSI